MARQAAGWSYYDDPDGLQLQEIAKPIPNDNEVLIRNLFAKGTLGAACESFRLFYDRSG